MWSSYHHYFLPNTLSIYLSILSIYLTNSTCLISGVKLCVEFIPSLLSTLSILSIYLYYLSIYIYLSYIRSKAMRGVHTITSIYLTIYLSIYNLYLSIYLYLSYIRGKAMRGVHTITTVS